MLEASFEKPSVVGFIMWGFWDPGHWRGNGPLYDIDWNLKQEHRHGLILFGMPGRQILKINH